jgi:hypothetical protein
VPGVKCGCSCDGRGGGGQGGHPPVTPSRDHLLERGMKGKWARVEASGHSQCILCIH